MIMKTTVYQQKRDTNNAQKYEKDPFDKKTGWCIPTKRVTRSRKAPRTSYKRQYKYIIYLFIPLIMTTATQQVIKQILPVHLHETAQEYTIPQDVLEKDTSLVVLILESRSLAQKEEKQNWFNLLSMMNSDQTEKLRWILQREKDKLQEIEEKYSSKKKQVKDKAEKVWNENLYTQKIENIKTSEAEHRKNEQEEANDLLDQI